MVRRTLKLQSAYILAQVFTSVLSFDFYTRMWSYSTLPSHNKFLIQCNIIYLQETSVEKLHFLSFLWSITKTVYANQIQFFHRKMIFFISLLLYSKSNAIQEETQK
jgi:hypothetical protein